MNQEVSLYESFKENKPDKQIKQEQKLVRTKEEQTKKYQGWLDKWALMTYRSNFKQEATVVGHCSFDCDDTFHPFYDFINDKRAEGWKDLFAPADIMARVHKVKLQEPILSSSFIYLRFIGLVNRKELNTFMSLKGFPIHYSNYNDWKNEIPTFTPVIKCLGCGEWAMLCELEEPNYLFNSYALQPLLVQSSKDLPAVITQFEKTLYNEPINCQTWGKPGKTGIASVCPQLLYQFEKDTLDKIKIFPEIHNNCGKTVAPRYGNGCVHVDKELSDKRVYRRILKEARTL